MLPLEQILSFKSRPLLKGFFFQGSNQELSELSHFEEVTDKHDNVPILLNFLWKKGTSTNCGKNLHLSAVGYFDINWCFWMTLIILRFHKLCYVIIVVITVCKNVVFVTLHI